MKGGAREGAGRKKGSGQAAHYRAMLESFAEELIQRVVGMAKEGDMAALKLRLDHLCAPLDPLDRLYYRRACQALMCFQTREN